MQVNVHEAKTTLSQLIERAEAGEEIVIARAGTPVVRLVLVHPPRPVARTPEEFVAALELQGMVARRPVPGAVPSGHPAGLAPGELLADLAWSREDEEER